MSTFDGFVREFPNIRVDFFRQLPDRPPALACFLSHVHSDHLAGLETFRGPFIYCSAATREILLRLEKAAIRLNYARGILENPRMQTYKHLDKLLKPLPLDTPTALELEAGRTIRVTLLDANHCVGAVMFLIEGDGKAVLYTGDIRCEPRFVTAITQNPNMVEYTSGWKPLDRVYLDTSVVSDYPLQTKADGLRELLTKLKKYPSDTIFHFQAWTYGYEEVWVALSKALGSKIHVDKYKMGVFSSLVTKPKDHRWAAQTHLAKEAPALVGFTCGNTHHEGCLTSDENVRIHSCEKGMGCSVIDNKPYVQILPIVSHLKGGQDLMEVGIGGGGEDLTQASSLIPFDIVDILELLSTSKTKSPEIMRYSEILKKVLSSRRDMSLMVDGHDSTADQGTSIATLLRLIARKTETLHNPEEAKRDAQDQSPLPRVIHFPYARHSSLPELRHFVNSLKPKDVTPCTFDAESWLEKGLSIEALFGDCCSGGDFEYDALLARRAEELEAQHEEVESQRSDNARLRESSPIEPLSDEPQVVLIPDKAPSPPAQTPQASQNGGQFESSPTTLTRDENTRNSQKRVYAAFKDTPSKLETTEWQDDSQSSVLTDRAYETRARAFEIASGNITGDSWEILGLISTTDHHTTIDQELGS